MGRISLSWAQIDVIEIGLTQILETGGHCIGYWGNGTNDSSSRQNGKDEAFHSVIPSLKVNSIWAKELSVCA